ncbi:terminal repeat-encoded protein [Staphylococcus phage vB_SauH_SAP1]|uniref:Terminal repeat-encoded protein n=1 Tax=Staphylococcus phage vB_SauH_SAP1 TaxID=2759206 RepID=A0A7G7WVH4_9CAUD|nr:terminal repeat-encoded protein [Staphylococcus phage vB_SauH_SAP1]
MVETYYTVYHKNSMKTIKDYLSRSDLIDFLYKTWHKDISNIYPTDYTTYETKFCIDIDVVRLIEAVNEEGVLLINEGSIVEW